MKNSTLFLGLVILGIFHLPFLNAQTLIYSENFNNVTEADKWIASVNPTQWNATGTQNNWSYENCSIIPTQNASNEGSIGIIALNHTNQSVLEFPLVLTPGIGNVEIVAMFQPAGKENTVGPEGNCTGEIVLQKKVNEEWIDVETVTADNASANKATKYSIAVDDENADNLRIIYTSIPVGGARVRIYDVALYNLGLKPIEWNEASNISNNSFTLNWNSAMLAESYEVVIADRTSQENVELVTNGNVESGSEGWLFEGNVSPLDEKPASGNLSWKLDATESMARIYQTLEVEPGTTLDISLKGWVLSNSTTDKEMRLWGQFLKEDGTLALAAPHISGQESFKVVSSDWIPMSLSGVVVPEDAKTMDLDFRAQPGVVAFADDFSVIGTKVMRNNLSGYPVSTSTNTLQIDNLKPGQEYSVYVYSVNGDEKKKSSELVVKTTGTPTDINLIDNAALNIVSKAEGIYINSASNSNVDIYTISGQLIGSYIMTEDILFIPISTGVYFVRNENQTVKLIR